MLVDMDAFFASVEQQSNPALRGKPIGVIGSSHRTVITTASYEARQHGVKTGMNRYEARRLCPELILVVGNNSKYTDTCATLKTVYQKYTPDTEVYSVDEAFLDVTASDHLFGGPLRIGSMIREEIRERFGINATVGIGPNKLIAKLAAETAKPDGLKWIMPEDVKDTLKDLPVDELWGIGRRTAGKLESIGIRSCGELGSASAGLLRNRFGIIGERLKAMGLGIDMSPVSSNEDDSLNNVKSIGHSMTLPRDLYTGAEREPCLLQLSEMVASRARRYGFRGFRVGIVVRYRSFETFTRQQTLDSSTNDSHRIFRTAQDIINSITLREPVRLLGVVLGNLETADGQVSIFEEQRRRERLLAAMDGINERYGSSTVSWGASLLNPAHQGVISPAWRPSGLRQSL